MSAGELVVSIIGEMKELSKTLVQAQTDIGKIGKDFENLGGKLDSAGKKLSAGVTAPIVGAGLVFAGVAKQGMDFEHGMAKVYTLLTNTSEESFAQMSSDVLQFSKDMKVPVEEVLPALYDAIGAGVPEDNVFTFLEVAQKGAVAGATNVGVAVDTLTSIMNAYGAENLSAAEASDILFAGINVGKMSYEELQKSLSQVIPTAASLQIPLEQVVGALAAMTAQGTPTAQATTQLSRLFNELAKEGTSAYDTFTKISGKSFPQFIKEGGTVEDALKLMKDGFMENSPAAKEMENRMRELADPTSGLALEFESLTGKTFKDFRREGGEVSEAFKILGINTEEADGRLSDMFGSVEAGNAVLTLTSREGAILTGVMDEMDRSAGQTDEAFAKMSDTTQFAFEGIISDIKNATTELGTKLLPVLQDTIVPLIVDTFIPAFVLAVEVIGDLAGAFNTLPEPVKLVSLGVIAVAVAIGPLLVAFASVIEAVGVVAGAFGAGGLLAGAISFVSATLLPALSAAFGVIVYTVIPILIEALGVLITPIGLVAVAVAALALAWKNNWFDIQGKAQYVWDWLTKQGNDLKNQLERAWHAMVMSVSTLKTQFEAAWTALKDGFSTIAGMLVSAVMGLYNSLVSHYNSIITSLTNLKTQLLSKWAEIKAGVNTKLTELLNDAQAWLNNQQSKFNTAISQITDLKTKAVTKWTEIKNGILTKLNEIITDIQTWLSNQQSKFNTAITQITTFKTQAISNWASIVSGILAKLNEIITNALNWVARQNTIFNTAINAIIFLKDRAIKGFSDMLAGLRTKITEIINAAKELPRKIKELGTDAYNAGKEIVQKLIDGLKSKLQDIKNTVSEITKLSSITESSAVKSVTKSGSGLVNTIKDTGKKAKVSLAEAAKGMRRFLPSSPAKEGPFKKLPNWDAVLVDPIEKSIKATSRLAVPLENALSSLHSPIDSMGPGLNKVSSVQNTSTNYEGSTYAIGPNYVRNDTDLQAIIAAVKSSIADDRRRKGIFS